MYVLTGPETIYMYEGQDYSRSSDEDRKTFDELIAGKRNF